HRLPPNPSREALPATPLTLSRPIASAVCRHMPGNCARAASSAVVRRVRGPPLGSLLTHHCPDTVPLPVLAVLLVRAVQILVLLADDSEHTGFCVEDLLDFHSKTLSYLPGG